MPARRKFAPRSFEAADIAAGKVEPHYLKVLSRVLAAHAIAEKLTADGYARALTTLTDPALRTTVEKNLRQERKHAALVFGALAELGISENLAERQMLPALKAPSFEAPRYFAERAAGELDLLMASLSLDTPGLMMIAENYRESSYAPHSRAAELILEEEADHDAFAYGQLRAAVERFGKKKVNAALREWIPRAANFFGPPGSGFTYDCITYGLKTRDNQELAELYLEMLARRVAQAGLEMPRLTPGYPRVLA
ncbi:MAG: Phenylacetic acid catabolic protein [Candidatus Binataceae bacterium]